MEQLVFDRTSGDVGIVNTMQRSTYTNLPGNLKALWDSGRAKGAWNVSDLNRVIAYSDHLRDTFNLYGYAISGYVQMKTTWVSSDDFYKEDFDTIRGNINALISAYLTVDGVTPIPDVDTITVATANQLERNFNLWLKALALMEESFKRSNTFRSAEKVIYYSEDKTPVTGQNIWNDLPATITFSQAAQKNLTFRQAEFQRWWE